MNTRAVPQAAITALAGTDIATADVTSCINLLQHAKATQGWLASIEARVSSRIAELNAAGKSAPAADMHTRCGGVSAAEGRRKDERGKTINDAPSFGDALATGAIGTEHVDVLASATARLDDEVKAALLSEEEGLLAAASSKTPEQFSRHVRDRARALERDHGISRNRQQRKQTFITHRVNPSTGMHEGRFSLHPELGATIFEAIDHQVAADIAAGEARGEREYVNRTIDRNQLAAEALGTLITRGAQPASRTQNPDRPPVVADITVIVDARTLETGEYHDHSICETDDGALLPPETIRRLACNGLITPIYIDHDGNPFNLGRTSRVANRKQRRALGALYRTCAFHGCYTPFNRCEMHHISYWEHGGLSNLDNFVPVCSRHHHVIHEGGWKLHLDHRRVLTITDPTGQVFATTQPDMTPDTATMPTSDGVTVRPVAPPGEHLGSSDGRGTKPPRVPHQPEPHQPEHDGSEHDKSDSAAEESPRTVANSEPASFEQINLLAG